MEALLLLFASFSLTFLIKETNGPFNIIGTLRNHLMRNKHAGSFFYQLLNCWHCTGMWAGIIVYFVFSGFNPSIILLLLWGLGGGGFSLICGKILEYVGK